MASANIDDIKKELSVFVVGSGDVLRAAEAILYIMKKNNIDLIDIGDFFYQSMTYEPIDFDILQIKQKYEEIDTDLGIYDENIVNKTCFPMHGKDPNKIFNDRGKRHKPLKRSKRRN